MSYEPLSDVTQAHPKLFSDARRFETGAGTFLSAVGAAAAITHLLATGIENLHNKSLKLANQLEDGLRAQGHEVLRRHDPNGSKNNLSAIVTFRARERKDELIQRLQKRSSLLPNVAGECGLRRTDSIPRMKLPKCCRC